jgi:hypothetical protein
MTDTVVRMLGHRYRVVVHPLNARMHCTAHVVNLVSQDSLFHLGEAESPDLEDYFQEHHHADPIHLDEATAEQVYGVMESEGNGEGEDSGKKGRRRKKGKKGKGKAVLSGSDSEGESVDEDTSPDATVSARLERMRAELGIGPDAQSDEELDELAEEIIREMGEATEDLPSQDKTKKMSALKKVSTCSRDTSQH